MASRPYTPQRRRARPHKRNSQWRRDRRPRPSTASLQAALAVIPNLPRPVLDRLTQRCIDRLDFLDGDPDMEAGSWNERPSQARYPLNRIMLNDTDSELEDDDSGIDDQGEWTDDREPEPWLGRLGDIEPSPSRIHVTA